jgi:carbamoyltransferase
MSDTYILGMARGHNSSVCLLKNGELLFYLEEERLSRLKYDGTPFRVLEEVKKYTNRIDAVAIAHTDNSAPQSDWCSQNVYVEFLRKHHLITYKTPVHMMGHIHHQLHAACAFYNSGFDDAVAVIVDGAGSRYEGTNQTGMQFTFWEAESIIDCNYPTDFNSLYKNFQTNWATTRQTLKMADSEDAECWISDQPGIVKCYEAVTQYCGFSAIEAGKTMGLAPYGQLDDRIPDFFLNNSYSDRNLITPTIPNAAEINVSNYEFLSDITLQNQKNLAYKLQLDTQEAVLNLIHKSLKLSNKKNVVIAGGYGLNCVANYYFKKNLPADVNLYVEPISHDAGTSIGAAKLVHYTMFVNDVKHPQLNLYHGPKYDLSTIDFSKFENFKVKSVEYHDVAKLIKDKNIVCMFQGGSEAGPRALGNRSILFDPTVPNGKDIVNQVKHREWFRPFAGSILQEHADNWFEMQGMEQSPFMMYAVDVKENKLGIIPSITHVDGTCRVQTVNELQNFHYYNLINEFYKLSGVPILFNTSFNLGGEPLVETIDDAIKTLENSELNYLYLPEIAILLEKK